MNRTFVDDLTCYPDVVDQNKFWKISSPLDKPLPTLVLQIIVTMLVNRSLHFIFQFLHQPRIVPDIITSLVLSPSTLKHVHHKLVAILWPDQSRAILETMANLGLLYAMFIRGLHTDLTPIARKTVKTSALACILVIFPFIIGCISYPLFRIAFKREDLATNWPVITVYWGAVVACTSFPTLAPVLAKLKLLCTDIGREALSLGMMNDVFSWVLVVFALCISTSAPESRYHIFQPAAGCVFFLMLLFILFYALVLRRALSMWVGEIPEGESYDESKVEGILFLVLVSGVIADLIGSHFIFGAFVLGMCVPDGALASTLIEKLEDCVLSVLLPLYFAVVGINLDVVRFFQQYKYLWVIGWAMLAKIMCIVTSSFILNMSIVDRFGIGVLLSAKGILPLAIVNIGFERGHLTENAFAALLFMILTSTILIAPVISLGYKRMKKTNQPYQERTLEGANPIDELRLIACIHAQENVASIIKLLELTNITTQTPVSISVLHLLEQVGQASAMVIEHALRNPCSTSAWGDGSKPFFFNRISSLSDQVINALQDYEELREEPSSFIQTILTIVTPLKTMHENICSFAEDRQATLIIVPFHKHQGLEGTLEDTNLEFRAVNQNVMAFSPCSVGLLVDRGLRLVSLSPSSPMTSRNGISGRNTQIATIYIGGPDDREALTYAWRMAGHPFVNLTVIRVLVGDNLVELQQADDQSTALDRLTKSEQEKQKDNDFIEKFKQMIVHDDSIRYVEKMAHSGEESISLLREMHQDCDLYIVGKGDKDSNPLMRVLSQWSDCPELGLMGDVLLTSDFSSESSVLVIQQYNGGLKHIKVDNCSDDQSPMDCYQQP